MKKLVLASAMALASISLVSAPTLRAQGSDQITIQNPAEFNAYQQATSQTDPTAKAKALEDFLTAYPQSVVKKNVLDDLMDTYQQSGKIDEELSAASRILQIDPNYMKAIYSGASALRQVIRRFAVTPPRSLRRALHCQSQPTPPMKIGRS